MCVSNLISKIQSQHVKCVFTANSNLAWVHIASHACVFRGARIWNEIRTPVKTPVWEARVHNVKKVLK